MPTLHPCQGIERTEYIGIHHANNSFIFHSKGEFIITGEISHTDNQLLFIPNLQRNLRFIHLQLKYTYIDRNISSHSFTIHHLHSSCSVLRTTFYYNLFARNRSSRNRTVKASHCIVSISHHYIHLDFFILTDTYHRFIYYHLYQVFSNTVIIIVVTSCNGKRAYGQKQQTHICIDSFHLIFFFKLYIPIVYHPGFCSIDGVFCNSL